MTDISNSQLPNARQPGIQVLWSASPRILVSPTTPYGEFRVDPESIAAGLDVTALVRPEVIYGNLFLSAEFCDPRSDPSYIENRQKAVGHEAAGLMWDFVEYLDKTYKRQFVENLQSAVEVALPQLWRGNA